MLVDAVRAESFRLSKNKTALFWSLMFVPIIMVVIGGITSFVLKSNEAKFMADAKMPPELKSAITGGALDLGSAIVSAAGGLANPLILLFVLIGAATLYAGDYRWETWRLISARNSRTNLLLAKLIVVAGMALAAMILMLFAALAENLIRAGVFDRPLTFSMTGEMAGQFLGLAGLSWLRIIQFTMVAMLAAVVTRSLLAALFIPLVVGVAQFFSPQMLMPMGFMPDAWLSVLVNPGSGAEAIKALIEGGPGAASLPDGMILKSWLSLALWTFGPLALALTWFPRQDLSRE